MHITLFFTFDVSLKTWYDAGLLDRELIIYKGLVSSGHSVTFVTYGDESDYQYQNKLGKINIVPIYDFVKKSKIKLLCYIKSLLIPFIIKNKIKETTIIKTNQMWGSWSAVIAKFLLRKPLLVRCGFEHYYNLVSFNERSAKYYLWKVAVWFISIVSYKNADKILLTSKTAKKFVQNCFNIESKKIHVHYNIIDTELFKPMDLIKHDNRLVFIGRLTKAKNLFSLLDAISNTKYKLDIIGDGEFKASIKAYIDNNNIDAKMLGTFPNIDLPEIINKYQVLILPSYYEGNPKALLEAMACGIIVICSNIPSLAEIITNNKNGILSERDTVSITNNIISTMNNTIMNSNMGNEARQFILNNCEKNLLLSKEEGLLTQTK